MSHNTAPALQPYSVTLYQDFKNLDHKELVSYIFKTINSVAVIMLAALLLRVLLSLFYVHGPITDMIMVITTPLVAPFNSIIRNPDDMLQVNAAIAYCFYVPLYFVVKAGVTSSYRVKETV